MLIKIVGDYARTVESVCPRRLVFGIGDGAATPLMIEYKNIRAQRTEFITICDQK